MKTVIYHSADFDGIFCREIARKFLGEQDVQYIGWNFGDPQIPFPDPPGTVFVMDLPCDQPFTGYPNPAVNNDRIVWIDHHASSIKSHPMNIPGYRIDGVAACRLAWQWFVDQQIVQRTGEAPRLPEKRQFIERMVSEPLAVRLAGEYDVWDKRDPNADTFQYALRASPLPRFAWDDLLADNRVFVHDLLGRGRICQHYSQNVDAEICNHRTWLMPWEGLTFLCVNHARFNSLFFAAKDKPETGHDALLGFSFNGKVWTVSLYHAHHRKDLDLSQIAVKYGGGGHKGACGFTCEKLPFL